MDKSYKSLATLYDSNYHVRLKGAVGNNSINNDLDYIYKNLLHRTLNLQFSKKAIYKSAKSLWNQMAEVKPA